MIPEIIERLANNYYHLRLRSGLSGTKDGDYLFAENAIRRILIGADPISKNGWLLNDDDIKWLNEELTYIHGKCYHTHSDVVHYCAQINACLDNGDIRPAQELLEMLAEISRVGMIAEMKHGQ